MDELFVSRIQRFSLHDGNGIRTTVFLKGCSLHCRWCHNPETIENRPVLMTHFERCIGCKACLQACKQKAIVFTDTEHRIDRKLCNACGKCAEVCFPKALSIDGSYLAPEQLMEEIDKDRDLYQISGGGVTISGGEPLLQADRLIHLAKLIKDRGYSLFIDTAGNVPFHEFEKISDLVDTYLYDIKSMDPDIHRTITGSNNQLIMANLQKLNALGKDIVIRMPIMEGINDSDENIDKAISFIKTMKHIRQIDILPIHKLAATKYKSLDLDNSFVEDHQETSKARIETITDRFIKNGLDAREN